MHATRDALHASPLVLISAPRPPAPTPCSRRVQARHIILCDHAARSSSTGQEQAALSTGLQPGFATADTAREGTPQKSALHLSSPSAMTG
eukprot:192140-Prymnesium_polylepis.1